MFFSTVVLVEAAAPAKKRHTTQAAVSAGAQRGTAFCRNGPPRRSLRRQGGAPWSRAAWRVPWRIRGGALEAAGGAAGRRSGCRNTRREAPAMEKSRPLGGKRPLNVIGGASRIHGRLSGFVEIISALVCGDLPSAAWADETESVILRVPPCGQDVRCWNLEVGEGPRVLGKRVT